MQVTGYGTTSGPSRGNSFHPVEILCCVTASIFKFYFLPAYTSLHYNVFYTSYIYKNSFSLTNDADKFELPQFTLVRFLITPYVKTNKCRHLMVSRLHLGLTQFQPWDQPKSKLSRQHLNWFTSLFYTYIFCIFTAIVFTTPL